MSDDAAAPPKPKKKARRGRPPGSKLTDRQRIYCEQLVITGVEATALKAAGYSPTGGHFYLKMNPLVLAELARLRAERAARCALEGDTVLREVARMALVNVADLHNGDWSPKRKDELSEDQQRAIVGVKWKQTETGLEIELKTSKDSKLTDAMRHLGLLNDKVEVTNGITLEDLVPKRKPRVQ